MTIDDIAERKRAEEELHRLNRTLKALGRSSQAMMRAENEKAYLDQVCRIVVEDCGHAMVWIGYAENDPAKSVRPAAYSGFEEGYLETLQLTWADTDRGRGPTGTAIRTGKPAFCRNMLTDPSFSPWREQALARGYAASIGLPLLSQGKSFGALTIYFRAPDPFTPDEVRLLTELADDLAHGINAIRMRHVHNQTEEALKFLIQCGITPGEDFFQSLARYLAQNLGMDYVCIDRLEEGSLKAQTVAVYFDGKVENNVSYTLKDTPCGDVVEEKVCCFAKDVRHLFPKDQVLQDMQAESYVGTLLWGAQGEPIGLIAIIGRKPLADPELATSILQLVAVRAAGEMERQQAEEEIAASELRYRRLFESAKDGILILDAETGIVVDVNPFLIEKLGLSRDAFLHKRIWELGFFKNIVASQDRFKELQAKEFIRYEDLPLETEDGRKMDVEFVSNVYRVNSHKVIQCNIRDITERKQAEEKLRQTAAELARSNEDLQQFAYVASHDLQEPLRMVTGFLNILRDRYKPKLDAKAEEYIDFACEGANRMSSLIRDLLEYSRVGSRGLSLTAVIFADIVKAAQSNLRAAIAESKAVITCEALPTATADAAQMTQLFQNLLGNALKFRTNGRPPEVGISAKQVDNEWAFQVKDNGIGIDPAQAERIFMLFQRLHTRDKFEGTGIGLSICKKIVERHGGRIWVESTPGQGATFHFTLPT